MLMSRNNEINILRDHFTKKGYRVHSGFQFGCELVLYADRPDLVHSDFCVKLLPKDKLSGEDVLDWRCIQTLCRSMSSLHKTLIICTVRSDVLTGDAVIEEMAISTEHAPFRYRTKKNVGEQMKKKIKK